MVTRTFTLTPATVMKARLALLAAKATNKDAALTPVLDAVGAWLSSLPFIPASGGKMADAALAELLDGLAFPDDAKLDAVRVAYLAYLRRVKPPGPPPPPDDGPIAHEATTVNLLSEKVVWVPGSLTQVTGAFADWLPRYCAGGPTALVLADMGALPDALREAGFSGRDNALYYTLSRSYAEWPWSGNPDDPDNHLSDQRQQLHDGWAGYLEVVLHAMTTVPDTRAVFLTNDGPDRCGDVLSEYSLRQLSAVSDRVERGEVFTG